MSDTKVYVLIEPCGCCTGAVVDDPVRDMGDAIAELFTSRRISDPKPTLKRIAFSDFQKMRFGCNHEK